MRLSLLSSLFLVASTVIAIPLVERRFPGDTSLETREVDDALVDLYLRDEISVSLDARDAEQFAVERRAPKSPKAPSTPKPKPPKTPAVNPKKIANKEARKDRKKDAKAQAKAAGPDAGAKAAKKTELKTAAQAKHNVMKDAGKAYKGTQGLPDRKAQYNVPAGGGKPAHSFTGKDVRESHFAAHVNNKAKQAADPRGSPQKFGKEFKNKPHENAGTSGTTKPLDGMTGKGKKHTFSKKTDDAGRAADHANGPVRVITKYDAKTDKHNHAGVIAHDQSRTSGKDMNDHFEVKPTS
ncbi:hypothetical protein C8J56DRAFT_879703 [Mycena floridula]|nr:hypothetical protein C8J56DRAFT_879703 [Mycena floridula]